MNMFARFDENPAMTLRVIKETKRYGRTDARTHGHGRTDGRENSIPPTNKVCGGYKNIKLMYMYTQINKENTRRHHAFCDNDHTGIHCMGYVTEELCLK